MKIYVSKKNIKRGGKKIFFGIIVHETRSPQITRFDVVKSGNLRAPNKCSKEEKAINFIMLI